MSAVNPSGPNGQSQSESVGSYARALQRRHTSRPPKQGKTRTTRWSARRVRTVHNRLRRGLLASVLVSFSCRKKFYSPGIGIAIMTFGGVYASTMMAGYSDVDLAAGLAA